MEKQRKKTERKMKKRKESQDQEGSDYHMQKVHSETGTNVNKVKGYNEKSIEMSSKKKKKKHKGICETMEHKSESSKREKEAEDISAAQEENILNNTSKTSDWNPSKTNKRKAQDRTKNGSVREVKKQKIGTENKLMEKLEELTGKSLRNNKDKESSEQADEKTSKKRKNVFKMEDTTIEGDDHDLDAGLDPEKAAVRKKKREKRRLKKLEKQRRKQEAREKAGTAKFLAIDYLKQWDTDRESWKFQKVRQVFLLQNMFNTSLVDEEMFDILLRYLEPIKGRSREMTVKAAEKIIEELENDDTGKDAVKEERARNIIQLFS